MPRVGRILCLDVDLEEGLVHAANVVRLLRERTAGAVGRGSAIGEKLNADLATHLIVNAPDEMDVRGRGGRGEHDVSGASQMGARQHAHRQEETHLVSVPCAKKVDATVESVRFSVTLTLSGVPAPESGVSLRLLFELRCPRCQLR